MGREVSARVTRQGVVESQSDGEAQVAGTEQRSVVGAAEQATRGGRPRTAEEIEAWLASHVADLMGLEVNEVDVRKEFTFYGLDSAESVILVGDLEDWLGWPLPVTAAFEYPTIESLARYVSGSEAAPESIREDHEDPKRK